MKLLLSAVATALALSVSPAPVLADGFETIIIEGGSQGNNFTFLRTIVILEKNEVHFGATLINLQNPIPRPAQTVEAKIYNFKSLDQFELLKTLELTTDEPKAGTFRLRIPEEIKRQNHIKIVLTAEK